MKRWWRDWGWAVWTVLVLLFALAWTVFYFTGPCDVLGALPVQSAPARCLK